MKRGTDFWQGEVPAALKKYNAPIYSWNRSSFKGWVEEAYQRANEGPPKSLLERIERLLR
jgi:hypothetical protein